MEPPVGVDLPQNGFAVEESGYQAADEDGSTTKVIVNPDSERLQLLTPFEPWAGENLTGLKLLIKAQGKCTTDPVSYTHLTLPTIYSV